MVAALLAVVVVVLSVALAGPDAESTGTQSTTTTAAGEGQRTDAETGLRWVAVDDLPREVSRTIELIQSGGPFPYSKDGSTFGNREGLLPDKRRGFYREYTVPTPGESDRGARRIVTGDDDSQFFYTADHYESFVRVRI